LRASPAAQTAERWPDTECLAEAPPKLDWADRFFELERVPIKRNH
jgi:hypothetical protein